MSADWTHVTFVESDDKPGREYEIQRRADGVLRCSCEAFRFIRAPLGADTKACKHMKALGYATREVWRLPAALPTVTLPKRKAPTQVETFVFRRAITFVKL